MKILEITNPKIKKIQITRLGQYIKVIIGANAEPDNQNEPYL